MTCPRTRHQNVGMATGGAGFLGRSREYSASGLGGNVALKAAIPSDYQLSILETVGLSAALADLAAPEILWKENCRAATWASIGSGQ
jgi:hypothetical protein